MRRTSTRTFWQSAHYDIKKDLKAEQLQAIGAIMLAWNDIEGRLDHALSTALGLSPQIALDVTSRINGLDGKFAIIRKTLKYHLYFDDDVYNFIVQTLRTLEDYKRYRDGIAHAWIIHPTEIVAPSVRQRGRLHEVLVSSGALSLFYEHLTVLQDEMGAVSNIIFVKTRLTQQEIIPVLDPLFRHNEQELEGHIAFLREHRRRREALSPLRTFPLEAQDQPVAWEEQS
jgi:hypothetical protein